MRARGLAVFLLLLTAPALAQNKQPGTIGIWSNNPTPNSLTDSGNARAPADFTVNGNLTVQGNITGNIPSLPGPSGPAFTGTFDAAVQNNAALKQLCGTGDCTSNRTIIFRAGFDAAGDGGAGFFRWVNATCQSLASDGAASDEGIRVTQSNTGTCFVLIPYQGIVPIEVWGVSPTGNVATNASRIVAAINESYRQGFSILLSQMYPTTQIVTTSCATIFGTGMRSAGLVYNAPVTTAGLSIVCPVRYGNVPTSFWIRLSHFSMITKVANGGTAIILQLNRDAPGVGGPSTPTVAVDYMNITGFNSCGSSSGGVCTGNPIAAHYWTNGITGTDLGLASFENNFIYGTAAPMKAGTPPQYDMQDGISVGGKFSHAPRFVANNIMGTHYAIRQRRNISPIEGGPEGEWIRDNNMLQNDYGIYLEGDSSYAMPQLQILNNSIEAQLEGIHAGNPQRVGELQINSNIIYMGAGFGNNNYLESTCIKLYRAEKFWITNNQCTNLTATKVAPNYGGIGLDIDGNGPNGRSQYGYLSGNNFEGFEGGIRLGQWTRIITVNATVMGNEVVAPRYFLKNEAKGSGTEQTVDHPEYNFINIGCGYGLASPANRSASYNAGMRATATNCVNPWP